jgi:hypothetical protein
MPEPQFAEIIGTSNVIEEQGPELANTAAHEWARASYWLGFAEGQAETIAYLKARVEALEARERPAPRDDGE